jgi:hypothetical protein
MKIITNTVWQRRGSCIVFDQESLGSFISIGAMVSLRQALVWSKGIPVNPPVPGRTILICGLETLIETMNPPEAEDFLRTRIRPLLRLLQREWTECGVVFGFTSHTKAFEETSWEEEVIYRRRDRKTVRLSDGLWDGTATMNMNKVVREGEKSGEEVIVGYYVARIS